MFEPPGAQDAADNNLVVNISSCALGDFSDRDDTTTTTSSSSSSSSSSSKAIAVAAPTEEE
ncbi:hypothetical protein V1478_016257 [Vespula squamosa]|uniref:Uncharacterized protein n=1 Tax=Vespula squamosa TaxID=30214 RepID=A0ABD1ZZA2_VESSQ